MADVKIFGIKNCNTMKKAFDWLDGHDVSYDFHDYKKLPVDEDVIELAIKQHGYETVINRKGMTWRKLDDDVKNNLDHDSAIKLASEKSSIIKRPLLLKDGQVFLGFDEDAYSQIFS